MELSMMKNLPFEMDLQLFAEEGTEQPEKDTENKETVEPAKEYTKQDLQKAIEDRVARERLKYEKELAKAKEEVELLKAPEAEREKKIQERFQKEKEDELATKEREIAELRQFRKQALATATLKKVGLPDDIFIDALMTHEESDFEEKTKEYLSKWQKTVESIKRGNIEDTVPQHGSHGSKGTKIEDDFEKGFKGK